MTNRRDKPRFNIRLKVVVVAERLGVAHPFSFVTRNISETGLFIYGQPRDFALGPAETHLSLTLNIGDDEVHFVAEIMHKTAAADGFGLKIVKIADDDRCRLADFIAAYAAANPDSLDLAP